MKMRATVVASALAACSIADVPVIPPRDSIDEQELAAMQTKNPHAAELLERGEALASAGGLKEAETLFRQSHTEYPDGSILWRRDCEALIALGQRTDAILACSTALGALHSGTNVRALVSAFVDGPTSPTTLQLSQALMIAATEHERGSSLTAAAAACDVAERMGDEVMLQGCAGELERIAPHDPATRKALSLLSARCPPWRFWGGWGAIVAAVAVTVAHALRRVLRNRIQRARVVAAALLSMALCSGPGTAGAQEPQRSSNWLSKWPVDDQNPEANIPSEKDRNADPLQFGYWLQDVALKGEHASKRGHHAEAAKFYDTLAKAVPDRATGFIKACEEYEDLGEREKAIDRCGAALLRDGLRVQDYTHFVHLVIGKPGRLSDKETAALAQVIQHMRDDPAGRASVDDLECEVGTRTSNVAQLKECTAALTARAPNDPKTISYLWALAVAEGDTREADRLVELASTAGVAPEDIEKMKKATAHDAMQKSLRIVAFTVAIALFLAGLAVAARAFLARRRVAAEGGAAS